VIDEQARQSLEKSGKNLQRNEFAFGFFNFMNEELLKKLNSQNVI